MNNTIKDGTNWSLTINIGKVNMTYYGTNAYPKNIDEFLNIISTNLINRVIIK